jgi:hypothetical protein
MARLTTTIIIIGFINVAADYVGICVPVGNQLSLTILPNIFVKP